MPSFDIVSELDMHEVSNAVDQANRELVNRYDFNKVDATFELAAEVITLQAEVDFQLQQMLEILRSKLVGRKIDIKSMDVGDAHTAHMRARQLVTLKQGLDQPFSKKIIKLIKDKKLKVQTQVQGEQVRVTGKKRDDLQSVMAMLREEDLELPLQYNNFRD
ncbi:MAG: YajQ family cyclic di-GMP-binding protein [Amphritea sp.]|uniref:YajQ family cyclic di-GMP-binding protein n=1 Tax=Amphritea sp. TaxID=1872502 RepID=UPI001B51672E|nr:YajQ family cyclic di-GMP-binding protein [Amphritea sp.]MBQ0755801.1 YajQ family cyclic di-GMP-binding protein [Amphritea sp.]MBQ0785629.1 YajQ family cyclic di-GMP-binding protein [Amphritea sp.]